MASSPKTEEIPNASAAGPSVPKSWLSLFGQLYPLLSPREEQIPDQPPNSIFGARLCVALRYTAVSISLAKENGEQYVWGYIPALVAKCGLYLKQRGIDVEGVFRVGGSEKRMRDLQDIFNTPPNEPIIPYNLFKNFCRVQAADIALDAKIEKYRKLIKSCPQANQYVLLYILDLLALFQRNQAKNKMTAQNLAIVFQPSILNVQNLTSKSEHTSAVSVIEFLIAHQDSFVFALTPPPPSDKRPEELTTSHISPEVEDYVIVPSDSDEEVDQYHVHIGGGARLARSNTPQTSSLFARRERKKRAEHQRPPMPDEVSRTSPTPPDPSHDSQSRQSPRMMLRSLSQRRRANSHTGPKHDDGAKSPLPRDAEQLPVPRLRTSKSTNKMREMANADARLAVRPPMGKHSLSANNMSRTRSANSDLFDRQSVPTRSHEASRHPTISTDDAIAKRVPAAPKTSPIAKPRIKADMSVTTPPGENEPLSPTIAIFPPSETSPISYLQTTRTTNAEPFKVSTAAPAYVRSPDEPTFDGHAHYLVDQLSSLGPALKSAAEAPLESTTQPLSAGVATPSQLVVPNPSPISFLGQTCPKPATTTSTEAVPLNDATSFCHDNGSTTSFSSSTQNTINANGCLKSQPHNNAFSPSITSSSSSSSRLVDSELELQHAKVVFTISGHN